MWGSKVWPVVAAMTLACGGSSDEEMSSPGEAMTTDESMGEATAADAMALSCFIQGEGDTEERPSPLRQMHFSYEGGEGLLCYGSPSANGREVFGGLVPFGEPWRLGANEATGLHLSAPMTLGGVALEAGSYSLYVVPTETEWEFHINTVHDRWGIPINMEVQGSNMAGFTATPMASENMVESLTFEFSDNSIHLSWEHTHVMIPVGGP